MKGTEKQIKWAENIIGEIKYILKKGEELNEGKEILPALKKLHEKFIENIEAKDAGTIIEDFRYTRHSNDAMEDYRYLYGALMNAKNAGRDYWA